ncbi:DotI/IcmL/TraM family protein [Pseudomonas sp. HY7a-MNA-CIBAN-0227]|uniref:DotI/IcmL/TraM family protein n=1 Tax=Pseudomonas sp. HY7a-MNA-CIBAN-0227 TaxID=3140474 RepID=UPI00333452E5
MFVFVAIIVLMVITNKNLHNASPTTFLAVQIEGEPKIHELLVQERPTENPEAMKYWIKNSVLQFYNYNANNYIDVMKSGEDLFTTDFYPAFSMATALRIKENVKNGFYISSAIVDLDPILVQQGKIDGDSYYKFYLRLTTIYKSETRTIVKTPKIVITVKFENPEINVRSIAIADLTISE